MCVKHALLTKCQESASDFLLTVSVSFSYEINLFPNHSHVVLAV